MLLLMMINLGLLVVSALTKQTRGEKKELCLIVDIVEIVGVFFLGGGEGVAILFRSVFKWKM